MKRLITLCLLGGCFLSAPAQNYVSQAWVADQGNGTYKNPVLYADYSDPDVCRVGDDYYLTSSSFNCLPGLQILHSKDLVNWTIIGAAVPYALPPVTDVRPEHGNRVWAPSIRHHNGEFYIFWGDPDQGAFMVKAKDPKGPWSEPVLVKAGKGIIDTTPLWDDDGRVYLVHAYAGSRAGLKSVITICELSADASKAITQSRIIFDGHEAHQTCEGPKFYKRNGYYYIFHPAGGVPTWRIIQIEIYFSTPCFQKLFQCGHLLIGHPSIPVQQIICLLYTSSYLSIKSHNYLELHTKLCYEKIRFLLDIS